MQPIYMFLLIFCNENYVSVVTAIFFALLCSSKLTWYFLLTVETSKGKELRQCKSASTGVEALVSCY